MKALILNGANKGDTSLDSLNNITEELLKDGGYEVKSLILNELEIGNCVGCFGCWIKTPGICVIDDVGRDIVKAIIQSNLIIYLTPIVFGGVSSEFKKIQDRIIPLILPFFMKVNGEIHHKPRYEKYPNVITLGVLPAKDEEMEGIFRNLIIRNSLNWYNSYYTGDILYSTSTKDTIKSTISNLLGNMEVKAC